MSATEIYDAIIRNQCYVPDGITENYRSLIWEPIVGAVPDAVIVDVSNVCEYAHAGTNKGSFTVEDFPAVVPPFPKLWMETRAPSRCVVPGEVMSWDRSVHGAQWAIFLRTEDLNGMDEDDRDDFLSTIVNWRNASAIAEVKGIDRAILPIQVDLEQIRWVICGDVFVRYGGQRLPTGPMMQTWVMVDRDGNIAHDLGNNDPAMWMMAPGITDSKFAPHLMGHYHAWIDPMLLAVSFMNCRNVKQVQHYPKRVDIREAKRRQQPAPSRYYTLEIEPMRRVLVSEGESEKTGLKKALHICRGHFSVYTDDKPLFGKYAGRFWIPAHVRGSEKAGKVYKDYSVSAPDAA